jgi:hypothetical protein
MSKLALKGALTGAATFTIEAPATSTNRTLTLPDAAGNVVLDSATQTLTGKTLDGASNTLTSLPAAQLTGDVAAARITSALNASGAAPMYACRAWVNFDGTTTTPSIRASGNVSSITDNGAGDYTINFTTALPDANYGAATVCNEVNASTTSNFCLSPSRASGSINLITGASGSKTNRQDLDFVSVAIFR